MIEFEQVVTRGGDRGESSLYDGRRYVKSSAYFNALGDVDELSSFIGLAKQVNCYGEKITDHLVLIQKNLLRVGAQIATEPSSNFYKQIVPIIEEDISVLEKEINRIMKKTDIEPVFILPGEGSEFSARIDVCRTIARRAERSIIALIREHGKPELGICQNYLNRLSDYFFVLARYTF